MTKALYDIDPYETEFDAVIVDSRKLDDNLYEIELDQTGFFPEQGGQSADRGIIEVQTDNIELSIHRGRQFEVIDVSIDRGVITHTVRAVESGNGDIDAMRIESLLAPGNDINGFVDWEHRFSNMQQHSGEHIVSGLVHSMFGYDNVGFHLSDSVVTLDFNGVISEDEMEDIEDRANAVITSNRPVEVRWLKTDEEKSSVEYRSKIDIEGDVRIVTIPDVDVCACCAPHVRYTGEIGVLKVMSLQNYKGGVRVSILCGHRAVVAFREQIAAVNSLIKELKVPMDELLEAVRRMEDDNKNLRYECDKYSFEQLERMALQIPDSEPNAIIFSGRTDGKQMRRCVNSMMESHDGYCAVFAGDDEGYSFIIGSRNEDCNVLATRFQEELGAKCGGNEKMIQGSVAVKEDVIRAMF